MEFHLGDSPVTSHSWNANRTRKFDPIDQKKFCKETFDHYFLKFVH